MIGQFIIHQDYDSVLEISDGFLPWYFKKTGTNLRRDSGALRTPLSRPTCSALRGYPKKLL